MIRVAVVGDLHIAGSNARSWREALAPCSGDADALLLAGDLTQEGTSAQARWLVAALEPVQIPIVAVLGNHDHEANEPAALTGILREHGVHVLQGESVVLECAAGRFGVAGAKGFGGGFAGACGSHFGEPEMKAFIEATEREAEALHRSLCQLQEHAAGPRVALLHYSPVPDTLRGERPEIFPFLGSHLLETAIDAAGADLVVHGHAHLGRERGRTARGTPVRNVARPVIHAPYRVYTLPGARQCPIHALGDADLAPEEEVD